MDTYLVLGNPVAHSKSPQIHARFAELTGQALRYERLLVPPDGFSMALQQLRADGVKGCNVTVPFKFDAFGTADTRSSRAELAQAANTLRFDAEGCHADNTDGIGLVRDLQVNAGVALAGCDVLLLGAGGAAAGVLGPLLLAGPRRLVLVNRSPDKAHALAERHRSHSTLHDVLQKTELRVEEMRSVEGDFDVIINATASSLEGAAVPVPPSVLKPGALACDLMYGPAAAGFLQWASDGGGRGRDGLGMLVEQAAASFEWWRGVRPPAAQVLAEMRAALRPAA